MQSFGLHLQTFSYVSSAAVNERQRTLIRRDTIPKNFIMPHGILVLSAAITGIALNGVDDTIFALLHNADMIGLPILRAGAAFIVPIKENDLTRRRLKTAVLPLSMVLEPLHPNDAACELRDHAGVEIATLIGTPAYKAGTPFHTGIKAVP